MALQSIVVSLSCIIGSMALLVSEAIESERGLAVGEWMSEVFKPSTVDSFLACLMMDLKLEEHAKRINVQLIYQNVSDTAIQHSSLLDFDEENIDAKELFGTFEFHLSNILQYQVR